MKAFLSQHKGSLHFFSPPPTPTIPPINFDKALSLCSKKSPHNLLNTLYSLYSVSIASIVSITSIPHRRSFFFGEADFFSAKRLFFRAARDVTGERSEPPWARLGKNRKRVFGFIPIAARERALALTSPPPDFLFISIPQCPHPHHPIPKKATFPIGIAFRAHHP